MTKTRTRWDRAGPVHADSSSAAFLPALASRDSKDHPKDAAVESPTGSQYVGSEACKTCHEEAFKSFEATPHWKTTLKPTKDGAQGCESCHGAGKAHVDGGGDKTRIFRFAEADPGEASRRCLSCHEYGEEHANFGRSEHSVNSVGCVACHSPHHAKEAQYLLVKKQPELCYTCHTEIRQDFQRPFRHRVDQGLVACSDCHNEHGGFLSNLLRSTAAQDQVCFKCHADKAGPFTFEHEPVKTEGCVACHAPHGSTNPRLLKRVQVNLLPGMPHPDRRIRGRLRFHRSTTRARSIRRAPCATRPFTARISTHSS